MSTLAKTHYQTKVTVAADDSCSTKLCRKDVKRQKHYDDERTLSPDNLPQAASPLAACQEGHLYLPSDFPPLTDRRPYLVAIFVRSFRHNCQPFLQMLSPIQWFCRREQEFVVHFRTVMSLSLFCEKWRRKVVIHFFLFLSLEEEACKSGFHVRIWKVFSFLTL